MNNLVITHDRQAVTTSLKVAEVFAKEHKNVIRDIENLLESGGSKLSHENLAAQNSAAKFFATGTYENRGKRYPMYYMTRDGFTLLAMGFTGTKALGFKLKYIEAFNSMEQQIQTGYTIPGSYAEALKLAADQAERIEQQNALIAIQAPKALFADAVATSHTSILIGDLAKLLKQNGVDTGAKRLFTWLRANGFLIRRQGADYNSPTQRAMEMGLFEIKETAITHSDGHVTVNKTPKVTGKGQQYFVTRFLGEV